MRARSEAWTGLSGDDGSGRSGQRDPDYGERRGREVLINRTSRRRETKNGIPDTRRTLSQGLALPDGRPAGPRSGVLSPWLFLSLNLCQAPLPPPLETASSLGAPHTQRISTDWRSRTGAGVLLRQANGDSDGDEDRPSASPPRPESHAIIDSPGPKASTTMCHRNQYPASGTVAHAARHSAAVPRRTRTRDMPWRQRWNPVPVSGVWTTHRSLSVCVA